MPNTDVKLLRDELAKVIGMVRRHERTIREQGDQLVRLALECDRAVLEMEAVRAENKELRARLAEYGQVLKAYDNQHTPPSKKTITQKEINAQKKRSGKGRTPTAGAAGTRGTRACRPAGRRMIPYATRRTGATRAEART